MGFAKLYKEVISIGLCTDCGNCAGVCPNKSIVMNYETELPELLKECLPDCELCFESCPGKDIPMLDMDEMLFGRHRGGGNELYLGIGRAFLKGHAVDADTKGTGNGGRLVSALLTYALENNIVDAAIVAVMAQERPWRVVPKIVTTKQEVLAAAQAKEALVPMNSVLVEAVEKGFRKIAFVGLPCHVHAIRKMQLYRRPKEILDSIRVVIGLFCGLNWSWRATEHIIEEVARVPVEQVTKLEYRAGEYPGDFTVVTKDSRTIACALRLRRLILSAYNNDRCTMCYDYANDEADVSVGDYWGLEMTRGVVGMSTAIVRTDVGERLVEQAQAANYIRTQPVEMEDFFRGFYELKKHGGAYHILERKRYGWVTPDYHLPLDETTMPRKLNLTHPLIM